MAALDQDNFQQLMGSLLSTDNDVRTKAEVRKGCGAVGSKVGIGAKSCTRWARVFSASPHTPIHIGMCVCVRHVFPVPVFLLAGEQMVCFYLDSASSGTGVYYTTKGFPKTAMITTQMSHRLICASFRCHKNVPMYAHCTGKCNCLEGMRSGKGRAEGILLLFWSHDGRDLPVRESHLHAMKRSHHDDSIGTHTHPNRRDDE